MTDSIKGSKQNKNKQKIITFGGIAIFMGIIVFALWVSDPNAGKEDLREKQLREAKTQLVKDYTAKPTQSVSDKELWISKSEKDLEKLRKENKEQKRTLDAVLQRLKKMEETKKKEQGAYNSRDTRSVIPKKPTTFTEASSKPAAKDAVSGAKEKLLSKTLPPPPQKSSYDRSSTYNQNSSNNGGAAPLMSVSLKESGKDKNQKAKKIIQNIKRYLPTGTLSKGIFITGVDAPTGGAAQANPHPVLIRIKDFGSLPNYARSYIKDCHIIGAASGNISSERVEVRLETLTCILRNGDVIEVPVKGFVTGEDGKMGMRGRVVEKQGQLIARALLAGTAAGLGETIVKQNQTISQNSFGTVTAIDPEKTLETGIGSGIGTSLEKLADYWFKRMNEMYPVIEMDAGRICDIVLTGGTDLKIDIIGKTNESDD